MRTVKAYKVDEHFIVVLWGWVTDYTTRKVEIGRLSRSVTKNHLTYEGAQAEIGELLDGSERGTYATIERHYS